MEYIIVLALVAIIMFCMGFGIGDVITMLVVVLCVGIVFVGAFFLFSLVVLIASKKVTASFVKMNDEGRYPCAVYRVGDRELKNLFPSEMIMRDKLYVPDKEIKIRSCALFRAALDKNAVMTIVFGSAVFIPLSLIVIFAMKWFFGL